MKKYDLVFGFGIACSCSQSLRRAGLQHLSFPGDWTSPLWKTAPQDVPNLVYRAEWLCRGFDGFFNREDIVFVRKHEWNGKDVYANERTGYMLMHDIPSGADLAAELPKVVEKYQRRRARLFDLIRASKRVLLARLDYPNGKLPTTVDDCRQARARLAQVFPGVAFDVVLMQPEEGRAFADRRIESPEPWLTRIAFDYHSTGAHADPLIPDLNLTSAAFKAFARVRDYRTREERAAYKRQERERRWAKAGVSNRWEYLFRHWIKKTYDLAFGVGVSCNASISLRKANFQYLSFPGDWVVTNWKREELPLPDLVYRTQWLCHGLDGFFDIKDFIFVRKHEWNGKDVYANVKTHYLFIHDIPTGGDLAVELPKVVAKYRRRYDRLMRLIRASKRVLVLRLDHANGNSGATVSDCEAAHQRLCEAFPGVAFDFAFFQCDPARPFAQRRIEHPQPWLTHITFDYRNKERTDDPKLPDNALIAKALKSLARVRDYRTPEERRRK